MTEEKMSAARAALGDGQQLASVARVLGVSKSSIRWHVRTAGAVGGSV